MKRSFLPFLVGCVAGIAGVLAVLMMREPPAPSSTAPPGEQTTPSLTAQTPEEDWLEPNQLDELPIPEPETQIVGYAIRGTVHDASDEAIGGALVVAFGEDGAEQFDSVSNADGTFEIGGLPLGLYSVEASAPGYSSAGRDNVTPGGRAIDLSLEATAELVGQVVRDGEGVAEVTVLIGAPGLFPARLTVSGEGGRFLVSGLDTQSNLEIVALGEDVGSGFGQQFQVGERATIELEVRSAPPFVVEVRTADQERVSTGVVTISQTPVQLLSIAEPVESGTAEVRGLPEGTYFVRVRAPGYLPWEGNLTHEGEPVRVTLEAGLSLSGQVTDGGGNPVANAEITVEGRDANGLSYRLGFTSLTVVDQLVRSDGRPLWPPTFTVRSDEQGRFSVSGLPVGSARLTARRDGMGVAESDQLQLGGETALTEVQLRLGQ